MNRIPEDELMNTKAQARSYAEADFEEPHRRVLELFVEHFSARELRGHVLDLGCGPGDVTFRFAARFPKAQILAIDGADAMLRLARKRQRHEPEAKNITFSRGIIPSLAIPPLRYEAIISSSFLHHLHEPLGLWQVIRKAASPGTIIFVIDLLRPDSEEQARDFVERYAGKEREILKTDFYNSLLAAFTTDEVRSQLKTAGLQELNVEQVSDRHQIIYGVRGA